MRLKIFFRLLLHIFPIIGLILLSCDHGEPDSLPLVPPDNGNGSGPVVIQPGEPIVELDIKLLVKEGVSPVMPGLTMLAAPRDSTSSDSHNLYIDVEITNAGRDMVFIPSQVENLTLTAQVTFVDIPLKKNFDQGRLKLVIGWTDGGLQASEVLEREFNTDSTLTFSMPLTRADSFQIADNVAVYGEELAEDRFIYATRIHRIAPGSSSPADSPALVGFVQRVDLVADRLTVSGATIVFTDSTKLFDADSTQIPLDNLRNGSNELTITGLAWGFADFLGLVANGWEFRRFDVFVAEPVSP